MLLSLSIWQVHRAAEKQQRLEQLAGEVTLLAAPLSVQQQQALPFNARVEGALLADRYFLLDNRTRQGQAGYEVIALLEWGSARLLPVNLGWVRAPRLREQLPELVLPANQKRVLTGVLQANNPGMVLAPHKELVSQRWPQRIQALDSNNMSRLLGQPVMAQTLWVDQSPLAEAVTGWQWVNLPPQKHLGYALQWFLLALVGVFVAVRLQFFAGEGVCTNQH